jgi:hypothetical protein
MESRPRHGTLGGMAAKEGKMPRVCFQVNKETVCFPVRTTGNGQELVGAPCGCPACSTERQLGHEQCLPAPQALLDAEGRGLLVRALTGAGWRWYLVA